MTQILADILGAAQPHFGLRIGQLESATGHPRADIRLTDAINRASLDKIRELGLDPTDTTAEELYWALVHRLKADETRLRQELGADDTTPVRDVLLRLQKFEKRLALPRECFALKLSVAKRIISKNIPRKAMAKLGYRSPASMLKHEPVARIYAAASIYETEQWRRDIHDKYRDLVPSDFESRTLQILYPDTRRWESIASDFVAANHQISMTFPEIGTIVVMPADASLPSVAITCLLLLLHGINDIRLSSAYLKLQQVQPDFGAYIDKVANGEQPTQAMLAGEHLPWRVLQQFYKNIRAEFFPSAFEPHIQPEDLRLVRAETTLAKALPAFSFWQGTHNLARSDHGHIVSLNMLDVALSTANKLPFAARVVGYMREAVWTELICQYLQPQRVEQFVQHLVEGSTTNEALNARVTL